MKKLLLLIAMGISIAPTINAEEIDVTLRKWTGKTDATSEEFLGTMDGKATVTYDAISKIYTIENFLGYKDAENKGVNFSFTIGEAVASGRLPLTMHDATLDRKVTLDKQAKTPYYLWGTVSEGYYCWPEWCPDHPNRPDDENVGNWHDGHDADGNLNYWSFNLPLPVNENDDATIVFEPYNSTAFLGEDLDYKLINPSFKVSAGTVDNRSFAIKDNNVINVYIQAQCANQLVRIHGGQWPDTNSTEELNALICFSVTDPNSGLTGIDDIEINTDNTPVEYFNLQGVKVENPSNGIYIRRQGDKVTKVAIR